MSSLTRLGPPPWPHSGIQSEDPGLLAASALWGSWFELGKQDRDREQAEAMTRIWRYKFQPIHLLILWTQARQAQEMELAASIFGLLEMRAAEEEGKAHRGAFSAKIYANGGKP